MDFDLEQIDTLTLAEAGAPMPILSMRTGKAMVNDDGSTVSITLCGRHSDAFRDTLKKIQEKRAELIQEGKAVDQDLREREDVLTLIACTRDWTIRKLGKEDFPCTVPNIRKLWNDPRFRSLREIAMAFIVSDVNFLPPISTDSSDTLDTASSSADRSQAEAASAAPSSNTA